ncbi:MAG: aminotransferase class I/II-fold pyridoxal phosphate-dependent enzyme [Pseudomonadota bacterium]
MALLEFVSDPANAEAGGGLVRLCTEFVAKFEAKINQLRFVQILCSAGKTCSGIVRTRYHTISALVEGVFFFVCTPVFHSTTFLFGDKTYDAFFEGVTRDVPIYTRYGNPTQWSVQEKVAALENAESAVVFSSGMAAIATTIFALMNKGGHIISSYDVYGGTYNLLREDLHQAGREVSFVDPTNLEEVESAIKPNTQMFLFEGLSNPLLKGLPLQSICAIAKKYDILVVIDNTFLSPVALKPLEHGADVVIHSATKYLNGHSDMTAGVAAGSRKFMDRIWAQMLRFGGQLDPNSCFLLERGMKTLALRMQAHSENANTIATALNNHPAIEKVYHPSLADYECSELKQLCRGNYGGVVSFEVRGGDDAALRFLENLKIPQVATSLGGIESLVSMPFNTSHSSLNDYQRELIGIRPGLVRLSVGVEDVSDLIADLDQALTGIKLEKSEKIEALA